MSGGWRNFKHDAVFRIGVKVAQRVDVAGRVDPVLVWADIIGRDCVVGRVDMVLVGFDVAGTVSVVGNVDAVGRVDAVLVGAGLSLREEGLTLYEALTQRQCLTLP